MILYRLILCFICFSLVGCSKPDPSQEKSDDCIVAHRVLKSCAKTLSQRYGLKQCGEGASMMREIESFFLAFYIYRSLTKEEARAILMDCAQEVITTVNNDPEIQKYLLPGGFKKNSVQIQIYIKPDHKKNYYPGLCVCAYNFGRFAYHTNDPDSIKYKTSERETYMEALALLSEKK